MRIRRRGPDSAANSGPTLSVCSLGKGESHGAESAGWLTSLDLDSESADQVVERFGGLADGGPARHLLRSGIADTIRLERIASDIFPQLRDR